MNEDRPSIVAVTSELPWPLNTGGHLRTFYLLRSLADEFQVRLVAGVNGDRRDAIEALGRSGITVRPATLMRQSAVSRVLKRSLVFPARLAAVSS